MRVYLVLDLEYVCYCHQINWKVWFKNKMHVFCQAYEINNKKLLKVVISEIFPSHLHPLWENQIYRLYFLTNAFILVTFLILTSYLQTLYDCILGNGLEKTIKCLSYFYKIWENSSQKEMLKDNGNIKYIFSIYYNIMIFLIMKVNVV